jgi:hypothetical protein
MLVVGTGVDHRPVPVPELCQQSHELHFSSFPLDPKEGNEMGARSSDEGWSMTIPRLDEWITLNQRHGWARRNAQTQTWRTGTAWWARYHSAPVGLAHAVVTVEFCFATSRRRDVGNWAPTAKAIVDGLVDVGVVVDDDDSHVTGPDLRRCPGTDRDAVTITVQGMAGPPGVTR